jgi:hypothetical protein
MALRHISIGRLLLLRKISLRQRLRWIALLRGMTLRLSLPLSLLKLSRVMLIDVLLWLPILRWRQELLSLLCRRHRLGAPQRLLTRL